MHNSKKSSKFAANFKLAYCGLMTIAIFGNAMKPQTLTEVQHILAFMEAKGINVVLSHELRQELNLRDYPSFEHTYPKGTTISDLQNQNTDFVFHEKTNFEPIDFALSIGGDGTFLTSAAAIGKKNIPILGDHRRSLHDRATQSAERERL